MKHNHHRHASTSTSPQYQPKDYYPLHRSVTDDHEDRHAKHHDKKSPITRFVTKLLGLPHHRHHHHRHHDQEHPHHHHRGRATRHKTESTTSITFSSVFHFHHREKAESCSSTSSSTSSDDLNQSTSTTTMLTRSSNTPPSDDDDDDDDENVQVSALPQGLNGKEQQGGVALISPSCADDKEAWLASKKEPAAADAPLSSPAIDALVIASQLPVKRSIQFVTNEFDQLTPIQLIGRSPHVHSLLSCFLAEQLRPYLPRRHRLASTWQLCYSLNGHGASLSTLYRLAERSGPCILLLRDDEDQVFGAFLNESIQADLSYYGTGECFLWKVPSQPAQQHDNNHPDGHAAASDAHHHAHPTPKIKVYPWTGKNEYMIYSTIDCIALGGGHGRFGLWLNQDLEKGHSEPCATFDNECLSLHPHFTCLDLEIWSFLH